MDQLQSEGKVDQADEGKAPSCKRVVSIHGSQELVDSAKGIVREA